MATCVAKYFPNGTTEVVNYVFPGETMHVFTEDGNGELNRSVLIKCPHDESEAEVFDPPLRGLCTEEELEAACTHETLIESLRMGKPTSVDMHDADDGPFTLVMESCFAVSYN